MIKMKNFLHNSINLNQMSREILQIPNIDSMVDFITSKIQEAIDIAVPKVNPFIFQYILPERVRLLIRYRNARRRQWQRTRDS
jgi:hypothetical protein